VTLQQLALDLPHRAAQGAEDFLVSDCNLAAVKLLDAWPDWRAPVQLLLGPASSGKTHLARVWQARSGARPIVSNDLDISAIDALDEGTALIVEDADRGEYDENALFHLINLAGEKRLFILMTARTAPSRWGCALPDLNSRLNGLPVVEIGPPDDALLKTVMLKHFADRQLTVDPRVLDFLALHVERSLEGAALAVAAVDRLALATGRKITRQVAAEAIGGSEEVAD
jgi:chromosomal replication initiation ATPase DnaA